MEVDLGNIYKIMIIIEEKLYFVLNLQNVFIKNKRVTQQSIMFPNAFASAVEKIRQILEVWDKFKCPGFINVLLFYTDGSALEFLPHFHIWRVILKQVSTKLNQNGAQNFNIM